MAAASCLDAAPRMKHAPCRFCRIYALVLLALAAVVGVVDAAQLGFGLSKFGGHAAITRVVALSTVTTLAPGVAGSALLVAFVVWAHPFSVPALQAELPRHLKRGLLVSLPGYFAAVVTAAGAGLGVAMLAFGVPWAACRDALGVLLPRDWLFGALGALVDAGLIVFLASRYLARLQAGRSSLPMKLVLAWTFGTGLRMSVGLLFSMLMPS